MARVQTNVTKDDINKIAGLQSSAEIIDGTVDKVNNLADVAFSGSYNNILDTPLIPTSLTQLTNDAGFINNSYHDSTKQDLLVSGNNIKTIDGNSILGNGDVVINKPVVYKKSLVSLEGQTDFDSGFSLSNEMVFLNGILQDPSVYTSYTSVVTFLTPLTAGDKVVIVGPFVTV